MKLKLTYYKCWLLLLNKEIIFMMNLVKDKATTSKTDCLILMSLDKQLDPLKTKFKHFFGDLYKQKLPQIKILEEKIRSFFNKKINKKTRLYKKALILLLKEISLLNTLFMSIIDIKISNSISIMLEKLKRRYDTTA